MMALNSHTQIQRTHWTPCVWYFPFDSRCGDTRLLSGPNGDPTEALQTHGMVILCLRVWQAGRQAGRFPQAGRQTSSQSTGQASSFNSQFSGFQVFKFKSSGIKFSGFQFQLPNFRFQISNFRFQASNFKLQNSKPTLQTSNFKLQMWTFQVTKFKFQASDFKPRFQIPNSKFQAAGFKLSNAQIISCPTSNSQIVSLSNCRCPDSQTHRHLTELRI